MKTEIMQDFTLPADLSLTQDDYTVIGQIVRRSIQEGIDNQVDVTGKPYPPLSPNTVASKQAKGSPEPTKRLVDSTNLRANQTITLVPKGVNVGPTRTKVASWMQEGTVPHTIRAKNAKVLRFIVAGAKVLTKLTGKKSLGKSGEQLYGAQGTFAVEVNHPGTPAVAFFGISKNCARDIMKYVDSVIERKLKEVS